MQVFTLAAEKGNLSMIKFLFKNIPVEFDLDGIEMAMVAAARNGQWGMVNQLIRKVYLLEYEGWMSAVQRVFEVAFDKKDVTRVWRLAIYCIQKHFVPSGKYTPNLIKDCASHEIVMMLIELMQLNGKYFEFDIVLMQVFQSAVVYDRMDVISLIMKSQCFLRMLISSMHSHLIAAAISVHRDDLM